MKPEVGDSRPVDGLAQYRIDYCNLPLFVHEETLNCAMKGCIPCCYKVIPTGNLMPTNVRPEMCFRANTTAFPAGLYHFKQKILTVGDGDFSFSLSLAKGLDITKETQESGPMMVATSYEPINSLKAIYPMVVKTTSDLRNRGVTVLHEIDANFLLTGSNPLPEKYQHTFDVIAWNFPCVRALAGADGQVSEIDMNISMLRQFFSSVSRLLKNTSTNCDSNSDTTSDVKTQSLSEVHITHKTMEPFSWWDIVSLAQENGLVYQGSMVFDKYLYPGYVNRKALDKKSFPMHDAQVLFTFCADKVTQYLDRIISPVL